MAAVDADELQNPFHRLQNRHVHVEVHPVDTFQLKHHMVAQNFRHVLWRSRFQLLSRSAMHGSVITTVPWNRTLHACRSEAKPRWCPESEVRTQKRSIFLRIESASAVHLNGLGFSLWCAR